MKDTLEEKHWKKWLKFSSRRDWWFCLEVWRARPLTLRSGVIPEYFRCVLTLKHMIGSDTSMSSLSSLPKILPNHQRHSPQNRILDIHLSLLYLGNSFELDKEISKISLVILYILHYSNQSAKCLYAFIWIFPYLITTRYLWKGKK